METVQGVTPGIVASGLEVKALLAEVYSRLAHASGPSKFLSDEKRGLIGSLLADVEILDNAVGALFSDEVQAPLPVRLAPASPASSLARVEDARDQGRFTVLVVDDDATSLNGMQELLERYFNVLVAHNGMEGARIIREQGPDVVITDLWMPRVNGFALLSAVRYDEEMCHVPLLVLSGVTETEAKVRAFEAGAFDYLTKPTAPGEIVARLRNALVRSETLRRERLLQATDDLTGLANRRWLRTFLSNALRIAERTRTDLTLIMVDQDGLKQVNDLHGHATGDLALCTLAQALTVSKRTNDCVARVGGDEFIVAMPACDRNGALAFIARVESALRRHPVSAGEHDLIEVGASFGLASCSDRSWQESCDTIITRADEALYRAKKNLHLRPRIRWCG